MSKSISKTNELKSKIEEKFFTSSYWIAQDRKGEIYIFTGKPKLVKNYLTDTYYSVWISDFVRYPAFFLCNPIKGQYITTFAHSLAQLGKDNFYLDTRGRLIVEDRNTPNLLKEQA